jgi:predicted  nucleic acid-binding Zn-ribbon protein
MRISSISSALNSTYQYSAGNNSNTQQTEDQIKKLEQLIEEENQSKDDAKTKLTKVQLYETQIAQLEAQIQQIQQKSQSSSTQQLTSNSQNSNTEQQNNSNYFIGSIIDIQV